MKKKYTVAIIGFGGRGQVYGLLMNERKDEFAVTAVCDIDRTQLQNVEKLLGLTDVALYDDEQEFFKAKRADVLVIATYDRDHVRQCVKALELGYDILLEKPISDSREEIEQLIETQKRTGGKIVVCHVLRYAAGFVKCGELLKSGVIGKLYAVDASERVEYWHMVQSFVRGQWNRLEVAHPIIMQKTCHDFDIIQSYVGGKCVKVSSFGELGFFKPENAPEGASERCSDCKHVDDCPFSTKKLYLEKWRAAGCPPSDWPYSKVVSDYPITEEKLVRALSENDYGRCVFKCDNDVCDRQFVQMQFDNGVIASLKLAFAGGGGRRISLYGEHGEIVFDERPNTIEIRRFGEETEVLNVNALNVGGYGHGGGDAGLISRFYSILSGEEPNRTSLAESLESHLIAIAADESRKDGGEIKSVR